MEEKEKYRVKIISAQPLTAEQLHQIAQTLSEILPEETITPSEMLNENNLLKYQLTNQQAEDLKDELEKVGIEISLMLNLAQIAELIDSKESISRKQIYTMASVVVVISILAIISVIFSRIVIISHADKDKLYEMAVNEFNKGNYERTLSLMQKLENCDNSVLMIEDIKTMLKEASKKYFESATEFFGGLETYNSRWQSFPPYIYLANVEHGGFGEEWQKAKENIDKAIKILPDYEEAKKLRERLLYLKLTVPKGNNIVKLSVAIIEVNPLIIAVIVYNNSNSVFHCNPNDFTLVTKEQGSYHYSSQTYACNVPFPAVDLQSGTHAGGVLFFETNSLPSKLVYSNFQTETVTIEFP